MTSLRIWLPMALERLCCFSFTNYLSVCACVRVCVCACVRVCGGILCYSGKVEVEASEMSPLSGPLTAHGLG